MVDKTKRRAAENKADDAIVLEQRVNQKEFKRISQKLRGLKDEIHVRILTNKKQRSVMAVFEKTSPLLRSDDKKAVQKTEGKEDEKSKGRYIETTIVVANTNDAGMAHAHWAVDHGYTAVITNINDEEGHFDIAISTMVDLEEKSKENLRREMENRARIM